VVAAGGFDPQPAIVARNVASNRVFTVGSESEEGVVSGDVSSRTGFD